MAVPATRPTAPGPLRIFNRATGRDEDELVYGGELIQKIYGTETGQKIADAVLSHKLISILYGIYQGSPLSRHKIEPFIRDYAIDMSEYEPGPWGSFNHFFTRKFMPGKRPFNRDPKTLPAFAEGRYLAFEKVDERQTFPVKGRHLTAHGLLGKLETTERFIGGPMLIARLCPTDYHRFHFPDKGSAVTHYTIHGRLHSVNPLALAARSDIFVTNERQITLLRTENFGMLAYVEVGAMCVGRIEQTHELAKPFNRGNEKGYFLFGASTVIVMGEPGAWRPEGDLLDHTASKREVLIRLGDPVALAR